MVLQLIFALAASLFSADNARRSGAEEQFFTIELLNSLNSDWAGYRMEMLNNKYPENMKHEVREHRSYLWLSDFVQSLVDSPRDAASGLPTGKRQHKPFSSTGD